MVNLVLALVGGLTLGLFGGWALGAGRSRLQAARERGEFSARLAVAERDAAALAAQLTAREAAVSSAQAELLTIRDERTRMETQLVETARRLEEQQALLGEAERRLKESFSALSAEALKANSGQFLQTAREAFQGMLAEARGDLGKREESIKLLVQPLSESLKRYESQVVELEKSRQNAYGTIGEQIRTLAATHQQLQQETARLATGLRDPKVRGRWGEMALRRAAELSGMTEHCDFDQQVSFTGEDGRLRPDMVVRLPGGRSVVVDAKAVLGAYLDVVAATDDVSRQEHLRRHAAQVRSRLKELSAKSYWERLGGAPEFVVLFLPGESFFSAALEADTSLLEDAVAHKVVLASPTTLIALLRAVAFGWRQEHMAQNAEEISRIGRELFDRIRTFAGHMCRIESGLSGTVRAYNDAVGSLESRLMPAARRFRELGAAGGDALPDLPPIDRIPRQLTLNDADRVSD